MKRIVAVAAALASLAAALLVPAGPAAAAPFTACAGNENLPWGAVKTDDSWDPNQCGNPATYTLNVWTYAYATWVPTGGQMNVCAGYRPDNTPSQRWSVIAITWDPNKCGHPATYLGNIWTIKRTL